MKANINSKVKLVEDRRDDIDRGFDENKASDSTPLDLVEVEETTTEGEVEAIGIGNTRNG